MSPLPEPARQRLLAIGIKRIGEEALASRLKVRPGLISAWASGDTAMPDAKVLALIEALDKLGALGDDPTK